MAKYQKNTSEIQTFVFFDLETSGLDYDSARILELSMIGVSRNELLNMKHSNFFNSNGKSSSEANSPKKFSMMVSPRVLHKYSRLYYPKKTIYPDVEEITGLSNDNLHHLESFNADSASAIQLFLKLPPPVCLVAHNGNGFDFPVLKAELLNVNFDILTEIVCIDSLIFAREFESEDKNLDNDFNDTDFLNIEAYSKHKVNSSESNLITNVSSTKSDELISLPSTSNQNSFHTPEKGCIDLSNTVMKTPKKRQFSYVNGVMTPDPTPKRKLLENELKSCDAKRSLFSNKSNFKKPFSQPILYYRIFGEEYEAHRAESDAYALMEICGIYGKDFVEWADKNYSSFTSVKPKWKSRKPLPL